MTQDEELEQLRQENAAYLALRRLRASEALSRLMPQATHPSALGTGTGFGRPSRFPCFLAYPNSYHKL